MGRQGVRELGVLRLPPPDPQEVPLTLGFNLTFSNTDCGRSSDETSFVQNKTKKKRFTDFFFFFWQYLLVVNRRDELVHFTNPESPALQPSPSPVPLLLFGAAGRKAHSSSVALPCSHSTDPLPSPLPRFFTTSCSSRGRDACFNDCRKH